jgi:uncharacterized caspase-like protein
MRPRPCALGLLTLVLSLLLTVGVGAKERLFAKSYALVIGIGDYPARSGFEKLTYPRKDAGGMATFLRTQGFEVTVLFDQEATRRAILATLEDVIAQRLAADDRVLVFYSGHGQTRAIGEREFGYIIPFDADDRSSSWIGMEVLRNLSDKMGRARHQMFIMDACYGGQIGVKAGGPGVALDHPEYVRAVAERPARQFLTAGGADQQVLDGGPDGYSYFTGYLLEALELGLADLNGDSYVTASELGAYITPRASTWNQTPAAGVLPGHGQGEFLFQVSGQRIASAPGAVDALGRFKGAGGQVAQGGDSPQDTQPDSAKPEPPPGDKIAHVDPGQLSLAEAKERLDRALHLDYDQTRKEFYRFLRQHSLRDVDTRRVINITVAEVVETGDDGWVAELDYFVTDRARQMVNRQGRFLLQPTVEGVAFIRAY